MVVDLRSDTVTVPTPEMRQAMATAEVGDDQYGEDPTVNALQETFAELVGKPAALFVPSGTMANQLALRLLTRPGDAVITGAHQHVVLYEEGAGPANAGVTWLTVDDTGGSLSPSDVDQAARGGDYHQPRPVAVCIEDTHMASGGAVWSAECRAAVASVARHHGLPIHLDGARLWHAAAATGASLADLSAPATTVMCCLSKGLAAPVGSLLAGPQELMARAVVERHRLGGAMRQAGILAAAGLVALRTMRDRLVEDHLRAARLAAAATERWPGAVLDPGGVRTNIVMFRHAEPAALLDHLRREGVRAGTVGPGLVRLVTHADADDAGVDHACRALATAP
ncbi:MAG: threonine aldolase family protein [Acidimicrobiales bacterium]